jgi:hypothetical protein
MLSSFLLVLKASRQLTRAWRVTRLPCKLKTLGSLPARSGFYPERIMFVLGTARSLLSCLPSLFDLGTIIPPSVVTVPSIKHLKKSLWVVGPKRYITPLSKSQI